jgi:hypothetical protein
MSFLHADGRGEFFAKNDDSIFEIPVNMRKIRKKSGERER